MLTLVTGGARSGKSAFAERLFQGWDDVCYIATAQVLDEEMRCRCDAHRLRRNPMWRTYEGADGITGAPGGERYYLLDCVTMLLTRHFLARVDEEGGSISPEGCRTVEQSVLDELMDLYAQIERIGGDLVVVTGEVGWGIVPPDPITRAFRDLHGRVNAAIADRADRVSLIVAGLELRIK